MSWRLRPGNGLVGSPVRPKRPTARATRDPGEGSLARALGGSAVGTFVGEWRKTPPGPALPAGGAIGNRNSHVYHTQSWPSLVKMLAKDRIPFGSAAEAE